MSLVKRKNGERNNGWFPSLTSDIFTDRLFGPGLLDIEDFWNGGLRVPPANISETDKEFKIDLSAPDLKRDDFKVEVENGDLIISSEKEEEDKEEKKNYRRREFSYSSFERRFPLPENVMEDKINAKYSDGVLHVTIPKKETTSSKPKKAIQVG